MGMGKRFSNPSKNGSTRTRPILKMVWVGLTHGSCGLTRFVGFFFFFLFFLLRFSASTLQQGSNSATALCLHQQLCNCTLPPPLQHLCNCTLPPPLQQLCNCTLPPPATLQLHSASTTPATSFCKVLFLLFFFFFFQRSTGATIYIYQIINISISPIHIT